MRAWLVAVLLFLSLPSRAAPALQFSFDEDFARLVSQSVQAGTLDDATAAKIRALPATPAMVRKMKLKDTDALLAYLRTLPKDKRSADAAQAVSAEFRNGGAKYKAVAEDVRRMLNEYVPSQFSAQLRVVFVFGGNSSGFAFDDDHESVYVNLARFSNATAQELAETIAHELFHAVQSHVMTAPPRPAPGAAVSSMGTVWLNRLLYDLVQEGTADLFTHPIADREASPYSSRLRDAKLRNAKRIESIVTLYETAGLRLLLAPPPNEDEYEKVYGLLFYGTFDDAGYELGWVIANALEKKYGKEAIFKLLKDHPSQFVLRYQEIAKADPKLPAFSEEFIRTVVAQASDGRVTR
ncbi:DUF5700 domain-containing putative Zn-dependent protease [Massilia endophytica]|uniref:DUF5700 domain-containing putative Zn-dependent protease n=1 Tax=Massilia endophytica TaxID=2899220 RepID=UPI001E4A9DC0|nr:DUF5700 domain-containing putative Zn-dependent protease [Massilia endophytica]UGQ48852.1 hypothetical protein LSQ66_10435 [Massilia endophytica]